MVTGRGERTPLEPLFLLYVLGRLQRTGTSKVPYADAEFDRAPAELRASPRILGKAAMGMQRTRRRHGHQSR
jgi:hypothetical protein